ncbi:hypothetical protein [Hasllibacter sp. MH4015]|uniref:hypothetical protein n=1 Tax=Hasllibacter sp. MH4015 TaxID=2854029 RepID=UPI001CD3AED4|nr:hypothetical protein [Hasllibacter sp. MH4015]
MRERDWTNRPLAVGQRIEAAGLVAERAAPEQACLVSGDLEAAIAALCAGAPFVGLDQDRPERAAIRIARDRVMLVGCEAGAEWRDGYAISPATGLYARFDLSGPGVAAALAEGTSADLEAGSPSAAVLFAGLVCLLTRRGETAELWVEAAQATYMTSWLAGRQ